MPASWQRGHKLNSSCFQFFYLEPAILEVFGSTLENDTMEEMSLRIAKIRIEWVHKEKNEPND